MGPVTAGDLAERLALSVSEVEQALRRAPVVIDRNRIGMGELARHLNLVLEARGIGIVGHVRAEQLDGHRPPQQGMAGAVNHSVGPASDLLYQRVLAEPPGREGALARGSLDQVIRTVAAPDFLVLTRSIRPRSSASARSAPLLSASANAVSRMGNGDVPATSPVIVTLTALLAESKDAQGPGQRFHIQGVGELSDNTTRPGFPLFD